MSPEDIENTPVQDGKVQDQPVKKGPRKAAEVIAETEERVRAEYEQKLADLQAKLDESEAERLAQLAAKPGTETVADQIKAAEFNTQVNADHPDAITVNFVADDMTILGKSWYRGEELTIVPGTPEWEELWDKKLNKSYLSYTEDEQTIVWGERKFRPGKWTGMSYEDLLKNPELSDEEREELQTILNKRLSRTASPSGSTTSQKRSPVAYS